MTMSNQNVLARAACLLMCICGQHGRIIFSTGTPSWEFGDKSTAYTLVNNAVVLKMLVSEEAIALRQQIWESTLPPTSDYLGTNPELFEMLGEYNELLTTDENFKEDPHAFIAEVIDLSAPRTNTFVMIADDMEAVPVISDAVN